MSDHEATATVKTRVRMSAVKIHGPNSTLAPEGTREEITVDKPEQVVEMTYEQVCEIFDVETADKLFQKGTA